MNMDRKCKAGHSESDAFATIKEAVSMADAVRFYGFTPTRRSYICCPFHADKTPSLKIYDRSFYCFGCGAHGSVIDFVGRLFDLKPLDAVKRLNTDFRIGLDMEHPPDRPDMERQRQAQRLFTEWKEQILNRIDRSIRVANTADFDDLTEAAAVALRYREALETWADALLHGTPDEQMNIFRMRGGLEKLCKMILRCTPTRSSAA